MGTAKHVVWPLLVMTALTLAGAPAAAQQHQGPTAKAPASLSDSLTGAAKADYEAGKLLFGDSDFAGALSKFKQAYERSKEPRLYWNMAVCEKSQRHYYRVQVLVQKYLQEGKSLLTAEQQTQAQELLVAIKSFIAVVKVKVSEPGAEVRVDGQPVATTPLTEPLPIDLGVHTITVAKQGFVTVTKELDVAGGSEPSVDFTLQAEVHAAHLAVSAAATDTITFDGKVVGTGRWEATVEPGVHGLRVTNAGRKPYEQKLDLIDGANRTVEITLEAEGNKNLWLWVGGGVLATAGLVVTGYFVFKPADHAAQQPVGTLSPGLINLSR